MVAGSASVAVSSSGAASGSASAAGSSSSGAASGSASAGGSSSSGAASASGSGSSAASSSSAAAGTVRGSGAAADSSAAGSGSGSGGGAGSEEQPSSATTTSVTQPAATTDFSLAFISLVSCCRSGSAPPSADVPSGGRMRRGHSRQPAAYAQFARELRRGGGVGRPKESWAELTAGVLRLRCASRRGPRLDDDAAAVLDVHAQAVAVEQ